MKEKPQLKFVIVGHVDHGKSTLIGRLLFDTKSIPEDKIEEARRISKDLGQDMQFAYLLDHLEEERRQGITIDTTQAFFRSGGREYVIIDAPGHVEFVKNMITGASQADASVMIVDAKEGIQEQTKRHAYLLALMGFKQVIVLVNKMDSVGYDEACFNGIRDSITDFFGTIGLKPFCCIPASALLGENIASPSKEMPWYKGPHFLKSLEGLNENTRDEKEPVIFPVQDIYKVGDKRIIAGKIESGCLRTGLRVSILPGDQSTTVKSVESFMKKNKDSAAAGESVGITTSEPVFVDRGDIIAGPDSGAVTVSSFKASVFWLSKDEFKTGERAVFRCATQSVYCKISDVIKKIDSSSLEPIRKDLGSLKYLETAEVIIKTKKPVVISLPGGVPELGRFVLVSEENISAGGIITGLE